jgi:hypothetical protein
MTKPSSARPPIPSAADSTRTAVLAPVIAFVTFMGLGGSLLGTAGWPFICVSCVGLILLGFAASIWGFYVAAFYGPRKHISTAILGFILNATVIVVPIVLASWSHRSDDHDYQGPHEARASQSAADRYRN